MNLYDRYVKEFGEDDEGDESYELFRKRVKLLSDAIEELPKTRGVKRMLLQDMIEQNLELTQLMRG